MTKKQFIIAYRLAFAVLVPVAIAAQLSYSLVRLDNFSLINFFSYFTIQSNLFAAVVLLMSAYLLYKGKKDSQMESLRGAATLYMAITGIAFYFLLRDVADFQNTVGWSNAVIHYVFPLVMLFDWLFDPPKRQFTNRQISLWLVYPLVYGLYCLVRAPFAHSWYPYPALNVAVNGYPRVAFHCLLIMLAVIALGFVVAKLPAWAKPAPVKAAKS